ASNRSSVWLATQNSQAITTYSLNPMSHPQRTRRSAVSPVKLISESSLKRPRVSWHRTPPLLLPVGARLSEFLFQLNLTGMHQARATKSKYSKYSKQSFRILRLATNIRL